MDERILVDTDILVDVARGLTEADAFLADAARVYRLAISSVTEMELIVGCRNKAELTQLCAFLDPYERIPLTESSSATATELLRRFRLSHGLLIPDALIAATACAANIRFVTKNQKDYKFIPHLKLVPYP